MPPEARPTLPNLIIIGTQKAGTTSLHYYLNLHPQIAMSREKELNFFIPQRNWRLGIEWYAGKFREGAPVRGESSPNYTNYPLYTDVPKLMHSVVPEARLIYILRDPIDRIVAHYVHRVSDGRENLPFEEALRDLESSRYVWRSRYCAQLERFLEFYPMERILVLNQTDLRNRRIETLRQIFRFLGVDEDFVSPAFSRTIHATADKRRKNRFALWMKRMAESPPARLVPSHVRYSIGRILYIPFSTKIERPTVSPELRRRLSDFLRDDVDRLRKLTGMTFDDWSI